MVNCKFVVRLRKIKTGPRSLVDISDAEEVSLHSIDVVWSKTSVGNWSESSFGSAIGESVIIDDVREEYR
ncbi:MAG: hypothetical protein QHI38_03220 [Armatimonadota bacterium]|nr:hypothetical protein [Armatimonadota bacterium]